MKALIFGVNGQDGYYLTQLLQKQSIEVIGVSRSQAAINGDVSNLSFVNEVMRKYEPDFVFHFAANSTTSHTTLFENHESISTGTLNILESVRLCCPHSKVFLSGSAMQFKNEGLPIDEQTPFEASSPYSIARIQLVYAGRYFRSKFNLKIYVGYFFNHDSPRRTERHINQKIVSTVKRIASGSQEKLELGNTEVKKEFNFAGDIVNAIWALMNQDEVFEAVIGCGESFSIRDWVEYCFVRVDKNWEDFVSIHKGYIPEYMNLISNPRLIKEMGWSPEYNFHQLADMMMDSK